MVTPLVLKTEEVLDLVPDDDGEGDRPRDQHQ